MVYWELIVWRWETIYVYVVNQKESEGGEPTS